MLTPAQGGVLPSGANGASHESCGAPLPVSPGLGSGTGAPSLDGPSAELVCSHHMKHSHAAPKERLTRSTGTAASIHFGQPEEHPAATEEIAGPVPHEHLRVTRGVQERNHTDDPKQSLARRFPLTFKLPLHAQVHGNCALRPSVSRIHPLPGVKTGTQ